MIRKKKWRSDYAIDRSALNNAHVYETQLPVGHAVNYPYFSGLYTLKNPGGKQESVLDSIFLSEKHRVSGFLESSNTKRLDLTGGKTKIVKALSGSVFHFFADDVCDILYALKIYPDAELIIDLAQVQDFVSHPNWEFMGFFFDALADQGIKFKLTDTSRFDVIYINDYCVAEAAYRSSMSGAMIFEFFKKYIDEPKTKPYRNVYLTRKKVNKDNAKLEEPNLRLSHTKDNRIDSEDGLSDIFAELGFEVIAPEDFKDFKEQLNFFYSVKTIASLTSSGLTNALFMQPGGTVMEISTPLVVFSPILSSNKQVTDTDLDGVDPSIAQEIHMFYKMIAFLKDHVYLSINNPRRSFKDLKERIYKNVKLLEFMKTDEKSNNI